MITFLKALLPGIAGCIVFWFLEKSLFHLSAADRDWGMLAALITVTVLSFAVLRRRDGAQKSIASRRTIGGNSEDRFGDVRVGPAENVELLSGDRIKGSSKTSIRKLDIE